MIWLRSNPRRILDAIDLQRDRPVVATDFLPVPFSSCLQCLISSIWIILFRIELSAVQREEAAELLVPNPGFDAFRPNFGWPCTCITPRVSSQSRCDEGIKPRVSTRGLVAIIAF